MGAFGKQLGDMGLGVAQSAIGAGMGLLLGESADKRQLAQQKKLMDMQTQAQRDMMAYGKTLDLQMWKDTSYPAQKAMLKEAGLNPGLMYGMGGGGGQTTGGSAPGVSGGHAPSGGGEAVAMAGMGLQMGLQKAQIENIEADTELKKTDATKKAGVDTELAGAQIKDLTQGVENKLAVEALTRVQTQLANLDQQLKGRSLEDSVRNVTWMAEKAYQEVEALRWENNISGDTWKTKVQQIKAELVGTWLNNALTKETTRLTVDKRMEIVNSVKQRWIALEDSGKAQTVQQRSAEWDQFINDVQKSSELPMEILREAFDGIMRGGNKGRYIPKQNASDDRWKDYWDKQ